MAGRQGQEWGWTTPALVGEDGGLIAGHARILAARQLGIGEIPVMVAARQGKSGCSGTAGVSSGSVSPAVRSAMMSLSSRCPNPVRDKSNPLRFSSPSSVICSSRARGDKNYYRVA